MAIKDYDAYLFDWDGTLAQTLSVWLQLKRDLLAPYGIDAPDKEIVRRTFGRARQGFTELGVPPEDLTEVFKKMDAEAARRMLQAPLYPGAREFLDMLEKKGKQMALVTTGVRPVVQGIVDNHGLHNVFSITVTGDEVKQHKPDPEGILYVLKHLGASKERSVMIGDSEKDIRAAHNAGIDSILFFPPEHEVFHRLAELQADRPTYTINSWQELTRQLQ